MGSDDHSIYKTSENPVFCGAKCWSSLCSIAAQLLFLTTHCCNQVLCLRLDNALVVLACAVTTTTAVVVGGI